MVVMYFILAFLFFLGLLSTFFSVIVVLDFGYGHNSMIHIANTRDMDPITQGTLFLFQFQENNLN